MVPVDVKVRSLECQLTTKQAFSGDRDLGQNLAHENPQRERSDHQ